MKTFNQLKHLVFLLFHSHSIGFYKGHEYLNDSQLNVIASDLRSVNNDEVIDDYEKKFASYIGNGKCVSFAAARMAFYALMKSLSIGKGSEVIITGFTCSVMANAVIRTGAKIIYADIDPNNYGSSYVDIKSKISSKTKMIVAQHTFGVPCDIKNIVNLCDKHNIFLLEDCALTFGSKFENKNLGNFGDAAIFSTDETKPINTIVGGLIYSKKDSLINKLKQVCKDSLDLNKDHQIRIHKKFLFSRKYYRPNKYALGRILNSIYSFFNKSLFGNKRPITLDLDSTCKIDEKSCAYPYPAKLPGFIARIGIFELENWNKEKKLRSINFSNYKELFVKKKIASIYDNMENEIIPLRFLFENHYTHKNTKLHLNNFFIDDRWFNSPLIGTKENLTLFGYKLGDCPVAERVCQNIINLPCNLEDVYAKKFIEDLSECI